MPSLLPRLRNVPTQRQPGGHTSVQRKYQARGKAHTQIAVSEVELRPETICAARQTTSVARFRRDLCGGFGARYFTTMREQSFRLQIRGAGMNMAQGASAGTGAGAGAGAYVRLVRLVVCGKVRTPLHSVALVHHSCWFCGPLHRVELLYCVLPRSHTVTQLPRELGPQPLTNELVQVHPSTVCLHSSVRLRKVGCGA